MNALVAARDDALQALGAAVTQVIATQVAVLVAESNGEVVDCDFRVDCDSRREAAGGAVDKPKKRERAPSSEPGPKAPAQKKQPPSIYECPGNTETGAPCATPDEPAHPSQVKHNGESHYVCLTDRKGIERVRKERAKERKKQKMAQQEQEIVMAEED